MSDWVQINSGLLFKDKGVLHYPTLKTVLLVEEIISNAETALSREEIKRRLGGKVMHQTLNVILSYLEYSGKIHISEKGVRWVYKPRKKLDNAIENGVEH
jgi:hypothetical protein